MTHCSQPIPWCSKPTCTYYIVSFAVSFLYSFPYIVKSKFGNYATLDVLAEQWRLQGGTFDLRVLMDGSLSKAKIPHHLMIEKVVNRINELEKPHLKLVVMHNFMWALVKEQASDRACKHQIRNWDSGCDIQVVESEAHDISQSIIGCTLQPSWPTVCEYIKDQTLMVNMLWEVAYGVCHEVLHLDSLEDFNATEADLMDLKKDILTTWESRDRCRTLSLRPTFTPSSVGASEKGSTLGETFTPSKATVSASILHGSSYGLEGTSSPLLRPLGPPPRILHPLMHTSHVQGILPTSHYSAMGTPMGYNFDPMMGQPLQPSVSNTYSFLSQSPGIPFPTPVSLNVAGLPALPGLGEEECPLVVGSPSHSSWVVVGKMIPTVTVSSCTAETTLLALPTSTPRVSTSCANVAGGDVHRVIQQCSHSSLSRALAGAGVGRGQGLAKKLMKAGSGRGQSIPLSQVKKQEESRGHADAHTSPTHHHEAGPSRFSSHLLWGGL